MCHYTYNLEIRPTLACHTHWAPPYPHRTPHIESFPFTDDIFLATASNSIVRRLERDTI